MNTDAKFLNKTLAYLIQEHMTGSDTTTKLVLINEEFSKDKIQMVNYHTMILLTQSERQSIRKQKTTNTDEDVNERAPFHSAGGKVRQSSYYGNQPQVFQIKRSTVCSSQTPPGHVAGDPQVSRAEMLAHKGLLQLSSQSLSYGFKLDVQPQRSGQGDVVDVHSGTALIPKQKSHATCRKMNTPADTISE